MPKRTAGMPKQASRKIRVVSFLRGDTLRNSRAFLRPMSRQETSPNIISRETYGAVSLLPFWMAGDDRKAPASRAHSKRFANFGCACRPVPLRS